jgi:hypothetical protein
MPSSAISSGSRHSCGDVDGRVCGVCVFGDVGERFGGEEVGGCLDRGGEAACVHGQLDRDRCSSGECGERCRESFLGEDRGVDAAGERAQLGKRVDGLAVGFGEQLVESGVAVCELSAGELEREPDPEQVLLRAVVEVALEAAPLGVACSTCGRGSRGPRPAGRAARRGGASSQAQAWRRRRPP